MKKATIILLSLSVLLFAVGCGETNGNQLQTDQQNTQTQADLPQNTDTSSDIVSEQSLPPDTADIDNEIEIFMNILNKDKFTLQDCDVLKGENLLNQCYGKFYTYEAIEKSDPNICDKISTKEYKDECKLKIEETLSLRTPSRFE